MRYQLNGNFDLGNGEMLINPEWKLAKYIRDNWEEKIVVIDVVLCTDTSLNHQREVGIYDYNLPATWQDADLYNEILSLPEFANSTEITE